MSDIHFGTDGWRAIIADDYTIANVRRVAQATGRWLKKNHKKPSVVIGHDTRFGGPRFTEAAARVLCNEGVKVLQAKGFVTTPMISYGVVDQKASAGIVITASHNPPDYNGFKIKAHYGGPALPDMIEAVEHALPDHVAPPAKSTDTFRQEGLLKDIDLETLYCDHVTRSFDLDVIRKQVIFAYDAMYGAGQRVIPRLFDDVVLLHCEENPSFKGQAPEPIHKNLLPFSELVRKSSDVACGLAVDGDADRIGMYDGNGNFIDSHHIILLLLHYLCKYKKVAPGKVVLAFSVADQVHKLCAHYGLEVETTEVGFKHIAKVMIEEQVLLGGEESGGIAVQDHIPERDGIWMGLLLLEFMAKKDKTLNDLIREVYAITGPFSYLRDDLHLEESLKQAIITRCRQNDYKRFGDLEVRDVKQIDGYKFYFDNDETMMIRPSGTEPVLRVYAVGANDKRVSHILEATRQTILPDAS